MYATPLDALVFQGVAKIPSFGYASDSWAPDFVKLVLNSIVDFELPFPRNAFLAAQAYAAEGSLPPSFKQDVGEFPCPFFCTKLPIIFRNFA